MKRVHCASVAATLAVTLAQAPAGAQTPPPADQSAVGPAPAASSERQRFYGAAHVGIGGPFGGNTTGADIGSYRQGIGVLATVGYALHPNIAAGAFYHYQTTSLARRSDSTVVVSENSARLHLYGLELRGMLEGGPLRGWVSAGIALGGGTGNLSLSSGSVALTEKDELDFSVMPVLALGTDVAVSRAVHIGPALRWYLTGVQKACSSAVAGSGSATVNGSGCAPNVQVHTVPDVLFLGIGVTVTQ